MAKFGDYDLATVLRGTRKKRRFITEKFVPGRGFGVVKDRGGHAIEITVEGFCESEAKQMELESLADGVTRSLIVEGAVGETYAILVDPDFRRDGEKPNRFFYTLTFLQTSGLMTGILSDTPVISDVLSYWMGVTRSLSDTPVITDALGGLLGYSQLLLHMNGVNGSQVFTDSSPYARTVTANGDVKINTSQSKFGGASGRFDGAGDYLTIPDSLAWYFATGGFTIDFWVRFTALPGTGSYMIIYAQRVDGANQIYFGLKLDAGTYYWEFGAYSGGVEKILVTRAVTTPFSLNTWYHVALTRSGNNFRIFQDGVQCGSTATDTDEVPDLASILYIGRHGPYTGYDFNGFLDELRVSKGIARWTSNFTPPTAEYESWG